MLVHLHIVIAIIEMTTQSYNLQGLCFEQSIGLFHKYDKLFN